MAEFARVDSIDALKALRVGLLKFIEAADQATVEADFEIDRTLEWLSGEQAAYWKGQVRIRTENVRRAKQAVSHKKMLPTASGLPPSIVDEQAALAVARRRLEEAEQKALAVKVWTQRIQKERTPYRASMGSIRDLIERGLPRAMRELDRMLESLDAYIALDAPGAEDAADSAALQPSQGPQADGTEAEADLHDSGQDRDHEPETEQR